MVSLCLFEKGGDGLRVVPIKVVVLREEFVDVTLLVRVGVKRSVDELENSSNDIKVVVRA